MTERAHPTSDGSFLVRASDVNGLPVVTIDGGEDAAEVKDVVYDGANHQLIGFTLNKRGWFRGKLRSVLAADNVVAIGPDAVMVDSDECLTDPETLEAPPGGSGSFDVIGDQVLSSSGTTLGTVVDVVLETGARPSAVGYEVDTGADRVFVPSSAQMSVSGSNLVLPAGADEFIRNDLAGFGGAVATFRQRLAGESPSPAPPAPAPPPPPAGSELPPPDPTTLQTNDGGR